MQCTLGYTVARCCHAVFSNHNSVCKGWWRRIRIRLWRLLAMQYAGSYTVSGLHLPCSVLSVILWRCATMQSILTTTQCAKDDEEESELDCGGYLPCSMLRVTLWRGYTCHAVCHQSSNTEHVHRLYQHRLRGPNYSIISNTFPEEKHAYSK